MQMKQAGDSHHVTHPRRAMVLCCWTIGPSSSHAECNLETPPWSHKDFKWASKAITIAGAYWPEKALHDKTMLPKGRKDVSMEIIMRHYFRGDLHNNFYQFAYCIKTCFNNI